MDSAYILAIVAGAFTLFVEANRRFNEPTKIDALQTYQVLAGVEATSFSSRGEIIRGRTFYIACYLIVYFSILSSVQLQSLLMQTSSGAEQAGSTLADGAIPDVLVDTNYGLPIFVSAAIISLLSMPIADRIEQVIRGVAYSFAGIPAGFYAAMDNLAGELGKDRYKRDADLTSALRALPDLSEDLKVALNQTDALKPYVTGASAAIFWPTANVAKRDEIIERSQQLYADLKAAVEEAAVDGNADAIKDKATEVRDNMRAAFALFCVQSSNTPTSGSMSTSSIGDQLREAVYKNNTRGSIQNIVVWCVCWSAISAMIFTILFGLIVGKGPYTWPVWIDALVWSGIYSAGRSACIVGLPALLCLAVRNASRRLGRWNEWDGEGLPPASQYLRAALLPVLACGPTLILWEIIRWFLWKLLTKNYAALTPRNLAETVRIAYPTVFFVIFTSILIVFFVCAVADLSSRDTGRTERARSQVLWLGAFTSAYAFAVMLITIEIGSLPIQYGHLIYYQIKEAALLACPIIVFGILVFFQSTTGSWTRLFPAFGKTRTES